MKGDYIFHLLRAVMDQRDPDISPETREKLQALTMQDMELLACPLHTSHVTEPLHTGQTKARCVANGLFHWQAPQRRYDPRARAPCGRAAQRPSVCVELFCKGTTLAASARLAYDHRAARCDATCV